MKKKKFYYILGAGIILILLILLFMFFALKPVSKKSDQVTFIVEAGDNKLDIVSNLKNADLIKSKIATLAYVFFTPNLNLQAGTYTIDRSKNTIFIINQINSGDIDQIIPSVKITFVEGKRFVDYAKQISTNFNIEYDDILEKCSDKKYLKKLIDKYWFLDDSILNPDIYYPLEGYLFPNTYEFYQNSSIDLIIQKLLDQTSIVLEKYRNQIEESSYSAHEILTIASIVEKEAIIKEDRETVSQVIYKRLGINMSLGMDVTTYYGSFKDMKETLTQVDLDSYNAYNTRNKDFIGLPVSAICNPSEESIAAALNPSNTDYTYFVADVATGKVYFASSYEEFAKYCRELGL